MLRHSAPDGSVCRARGKLDVPIRALKYPDYCMHERRSAEISSVLAKLVTLSAPVRDLSEECKNLTLQNFGRWERSLNEVH